MQERKQSIIGHCTAAALFLSLMLAASFYDLNISKALSDKDSFFGALFAIIGEYPAYVIPPLSAVILFYNADRPSDKKASVSIRIFSGILCVIGYYLFFSGSTTLVELPHRTAFALVYAAGFGLLTLYLGQYVNRDVMHKLCKWAIFALVVVLLSLIVINVCKQLWGRMRFRQMLEINNFSGFTPWYAPQGIKGGDYTSFPSGHTASAANLFVITLIADVFPRHKKKKAIFYTAAAIFTLLTALSRIVYNAHFLSDVLVGGALSYMCFYIMKVVFFRKSEFTFPDKEFENE